MHVTLAFLGWVPDERLGPLTDAALAAVTGIGPFDLSFDHAGRFPPTGRPRALWLGVGEGAEELAHLAASVSRQVMARSFVLEDRPFAPHLTLARVRAEASGPESRTIAAAIDALRVPDLVTRVDRIAVVESTLSPHGPRYATRALAVLS